MSSAVLDAAATVLCPHGGVAQPIALNSRVRVSGGPIVVESSSYVVAGCSLTNSGQSPCTTARFLGGAQRVRAHGAAVVLAQSPSMSVPAGAPLQVVATQARVRGI